MMRSVTATSIAYAVLALACKAKAPPTEAKVAPNAPLAPSIPAAPSTPTSSAALRAENVVGPFRIVPPVPPFERGMMDHVDLVGWSADASRFGFCVTNGGRGDRSCRFTIAATGDREDFGEWSDAHETIEPALTRRLDARVAALAVTDKSPPSWRFSDITVTWRVTEGRQEPPMTRGVLYVGGRVEGEAAVFPIAMSNSEPYFDRIHAEAITVSPDGRFFAVLSHSFAGEFTDTFTPTILPVTEFAARVYNDSGFAHHKKGEYARAAELFAKAAAVDAASKLPPYNLACAYARLGDARADAALRDAFARVPAEERANVRAKARADADFDSVRTAPWFVAMTAADAEPIPGDR